MCIRDSIISDIESLIKRVFIRYDPGILEKICIKISAKVYKWLDINVELALGPLFLDPKEGFEPFVCTLVAVLEVARGIRIQKHYCMIVPKVGIEDFFLWNYYCFAMKRA